MEIKLKDRFGRIFAGMAGGWSSFSNAHGLHSDVAATEHIISHLSDIYWLIILIFSLMIPALITKHKRFK